MSSFFSNNLPQCVSHLLLTVLHHTLLPVVYAFNKSFFVGILGLIKVFFEVTSSDAQHAASARYFFVFRNQPTDSGFDAFGLSFRGILNDVCRRTLVLLF